MASIFARPQCVNKKEHQFYITGSLWVESTSHWWIPLTKGQSLQKCLHGIAKIDQLGLQFGPDLIACLSDPNQYSQEQRAE